MMTQNPLGRLRLDCRLTSREATMCTRRAPGEGAALSDDLPVNIGPQSQQGTGAAASRDDHTHYLPHDSTLAFSDGALGVSIHDVVEHLSQRIQYYTNENNYDTDGSGAGQVYNSSRYPKNLNWVKAFIRVPLGVDDALYRAGVYRVASDNEILEVLGQSETTGIITDTGTYRFDFLAEDTSALGIPLEGSERIMVLIRRIGAGDTAETGLRHGSEDDDSPNASYPDAAVDFVLANHVIVQHENPTVGQTTHSHGGGIRGNLQLGYVVIIDHGSLVGDERNVNVAHIDSGAATDDQFIGNDGAGNALWKAPPSGGGGGGTDPETLFDNHPTLVQIGTLASNITTTVTSLTLAALPTETVNTADFLLIDSEVIDLSVVNALILSGTRGQRGTDAAAHLAGTPIYLLTTTNGGLGRTLTTRSWVYGNSNQNVFDLGKALTEAADDGKECFIEVEYDANDARRYGAITISAQTLREIRSLSRTSTSTTHETFPLIMQRLDATVLTSNAPMLMYFGRRRFSATDATNFSVTEGNDGLRLAVGMGGSAAIIYRFYMRVSLVAPGGGAGGQESPGSSGFGGDLIILYLRAANESRPADPVAPYSGGVYVTDFGDWVDDIADLTGTGFDWVAVGGTAEDEDGAIVNRTWALSAYISVQYAEIVQDHSTYTTTAGTGSRFVRHRLTDGTWGPWVPLSLTDWVPVVSDHNGYVIEDTTVSTGTLNFDATYFTEMRVTVYTFGAFDAGVPINLGVRGSKIATRWGSNWTGLSTSNATLGFGSYKLRLDDKQGWISFSCTTMPGVTYRVISKTTTPTNPTLGRAAEWTW